MGRYDMADEQQAPADPGGRFRHAVRANVIWDDVEATLEASGAEISEGEGSRVRIALNGVRAVFHRPHPEKETDKGALRSMRRFLTEAGVTP